MVFKDYEVPKDRCPACGYGFDRAASLSGEGLPSPGDFSVCIECYLPLRFGYDRKLRVATDGDLAELALENPRNFHLLMAAQNAIHQMHVEKAARKKNPAAKKMEAEQ